MSSSLIKYCHAASAELRLPITVPNPAIPNALARPVADHRHEARGFQAPTVSLGDSCGRHPHSPHSNCMDAQKSWVSGFPYQRAMTAASSSRRKKLNTASRRSFTGFSLRCPIDLNPSGYVVVTAGMCRTNPFSPEKSSHATIPKNYELHTISRLFSPCRADIEDDRARAGSNQ